MLNNMSDESLLKEDFFEEKSAVFSDFIYGNRVNIFLFLLGLIMLGSGVLIYQNSQNTSKIEVIENVDEDDESGEIFVEIAGAVEKPGVYRLSQTSRVEDLLITSGGLSASADRNWVDRYINRAAKLTDGQKFYIPKVDEQSTGKSAENLSDGTSGFLNGEYSRIISVNINTASQIELETLPGIGPVFAQSIIDHRPYSTADELLRKDVLKQYVYEKIKDRVCVN